MVELTLGLMSTPAPGSLKTFCFTGLREGDGEKLQSCVVALEDERKKIEVFRRELPLCMQLVNDAIEALKSHLAGGSKVSKPAIDIDLEKPSWMAEAQLWTSSNGKENQTSAVKPQAQRLVLNSNSGAFSPFVRKNTSSSNSEESPSTSRSSDCPSSMHQQILSDQEHQQEQQHQHQQIQPEISDKSNNCLNTNNMNSNNNRKARRCWSAELHKRFLGALEQLGGSHATPKLIREIMKVDGLTNDEVKSHLQKYRLHTRRPVQRSETPPVVIWVPAEYQKCQVPGLSTFFAQQQQQQQQQQENQRVEVMELEKNPIPSSSSVESEQVQHGEIDDDGDVTEAEDSSKLVVVDAAEDEKMQTKS